MATNISITVGTDGLEEIKRLLPGEPVSSILNDALHRKVAALKLKALLEEMERENPMSDDGRRAGDELWNRIVSSSTPARSRKKRRRSGASSKGQ